MLLRKLRKIYYDTNIKTKNAILKHEKSNFCFLKNDYKSTCFNLHCGPCGLLMIFWTDATVAVHVSSEVSPWELILLTVLLALAEIAELLEFARLVELLVFATLVELLAFAAIVTLLTLVTEFCNVKSYFASLFRCAFFFSTFFVSWFCLMVPREDFFSLFSFAMSFGVCSLFPLLNEEMD